MSNKECMNEEEFGIHGSMTGAAVFRRMITSQRILLKYDINYWVSADIDYWVSAERRNSPLPLLGQVLLSLGPAELEAEVDFVERAHR